jgi:iron complex outermembrane receptor protein
MHTGKGHRGWGRLAVACAVAAAALAAAQAVRADIPTTRPSAHPPATQPARAGTAASQPAAAVSGKPGGDGSDLTSLSIEDLMNVEVYSAAKHTQKASETPAAITVISQEDIRRSNMTTIPELLRMVPGMDVAQINASQWAISTRGFNDLYSNKLLVMMDGRSVYTPLFSGVYWDTIDYVLPDLERIEAIRGPGATLWGANAVNGVINITTKSARDTQGVLLEGIGGNEQQQAAVRFGGKIDDDTYFRVYGKYRNFDDFNAIDGGDAHDGWHDIRSGFRMDRFTGGDTTLTVQGDIYNERAGQTLNFPSFTPPFAVPTPVENDNDGGNLLARWKKQFSATSDLSVQFYYDRIDRDDVQLGYQLDTFDLDFQHHLQLAPRHDFIYGGEARFLRDNIRNSQFGTFTPTRRDDYLLSAFVQDDMTIVQDRLHFILGTKLEQNSYSGFEVEPSARLLWTPNEQNTIWGAVSRAVRTPSRWEQDSQLVFATMPTSSGLPARIDTFGNSNFDSEKLLAVETGYRVKPTQTFSVDATVFFNDYNDLRGGTNGAPIFMPAPVPHLLVPVTLNNGTFGETYGAEIAATWKVTPIWRLSGSYSWLDIQLHHLTGTSNTMETIFEGTSPRNQAQLHSYLDITRNLEFNAALYYVDDLRTGHIPAYARVDAGITWRPRDNLSITVAAQNLFSAQHLEFNSGLFFTAPTKIPRTYYAELTYQF